MTTEVESLRTELDSYRQRELADLRSALAAAREAAEHYRAEAIRNADVGKQLAARYEKEVEELRRELREMKASEAHARRFGVHSR